MLEHIEKCSYRAVIHADEVHGIADCQLHEGHCGPCVGAVPDSHERYVWCGRVCAGCQIQGESDDVLLVTVLPAGMEAVISGKIQLRCLLEEIS